MLVSLIITLQASNQDAMLQLIARFQPLLRKHTRILNYEDSYHELIDPILQIKKRDQIVLRFVLLIDGFQ